MGVITFGCRLNGAESEAIAGLAPAGMIVVNTCAVTAEAERQARQAIRRVHREHPDAPIVVTGCAATVDAPAWGALPGVTRTVTNADKLRSASWGATGSTPIARRRTRTFIDVQHGCDHACTFCIIPRGRGPNRSVPPDAVVASVRHAVEAGAREVVLTGVDLTSYDAGITLGWLVRRVLASVPELPRLRLSSLDPAAIDPALWDALAHEPRLMPHLHLSLQSGSDLVLKRMRRRHARAGALAVVRRARALRPGLAVGADLIAGFPTETGAHEAETLDFVTEADLTYLHVFPYSPRPGTPAARMPQVPEPMRRARAARLRALGEAQAARFHAGLRGRAAIVLAERGGVGRTEHFAPVWVAAEPGLLVPVRLAQVQQGRLRTVIGSDRPPDGAPRPPLPAAKGHRPPPFPPGEGIGEGAC